MHSVPLPPPTHLVFYIYLTSHEGLPGPWPSACEDMWFELEHRKNDVGYLGPTSTGRNSRPPYWREHYQTYPPEEIDVLARKALTCFSRHIRHYGNDVLHFTGRLECLVNVISTMSFRLPTRNHIQSAPYIIRSDVLVSTIHEIIVFRLELVSDEGVFLMRVYS
ncbi:hypothetical protein BDV59DRAFT_172565 [Aspergillus ambiguus]|uniref:uncharacterized protein n=1 Tax=Aspergillus ambiguus TaxID=176160 RepID=UPI003CCE233B